SASFNTPQTFAITVVHPLLDALPIYDFTVTNPVAVLDSLSQTSATLNATAFTLTVRGTKFVSGAVVHFAGTALTTTFGSSTSLTAAVTAAQLKTTETFAIPLVNPGVAASNSHDFTVTIPVAGLDSLSNRRAT